MSKKKVKSTSSSKQKASHSLSLTKVAIIALIVIAASIVAKVLLTGASAKVLGIQTLLAKGDDSNSGSSGSGSSGSGSSGSGSSGSSGNSSSGSSGSSSSGASGSSTGGSGSSVSPVKIETRIVQPTTSADNEKGEAGLRTKVETKSDQTKTEVRLSETERIRTRTKDGRTRIDITSGGIKTRLEIRDDRVVIKAEQEDGTGVELEDETLLKIDERLAKDNIKIATAGAEAFVIQRGIAGALTNFPVSIDLATNTLSVNTPSGLRTLTVLPDQAVQNLLASNIVSRIGGQAVVDAAKSGELTSVSQLSRLRVENGVPIYEINGVSDQKLLGFIPVQIEKEVTVSAETGDVVATDVSLGNRILDLLSL